MESADEVLLGEATPQSHLVEKDGAGSNHPEGRMVFHCRPDLSGRTLLFQGRNSRAAGGIEQRQSVPVQLLTIDGRSQLGVPVVGPRSTDSAFYPGQDDDKLARILVTTSPLTDAASELRLHRLQLAIAVAAAANILLTVALLCPAATGAWYHVDAYQSARGLQDVARVLAVRPALLMIAVLSNVSLVLAAYLRKDGLLTVHISVLAIVDIWSLVLLLPHALFLVRFLFDALLMGVALEARSHLEHAWFLTHFHRIRA